MGRKASQAVSVARQEPTSGWCMVSLGDVVVQRQDQEHDPASAGFERFLMVDHLDADRLKISRWGTIADGDLPPTFYKVFRSGQVLYPTRNPHLRRLAYSDFDGICGEKTLTLESNGEVAPRLLPFIFQTEKFIEHAKSMAIGSTNPHVRWRDIAAYQFPLPPIEEQHQIADILWAANDVYERFQYSFEALTIFQAKHAERLLACGTRPQRKSKAAIEQMPSGWSLEFIANHVELASGQVDPRREPYCNMILIAPNHIESGTGRLLESVSAADQNAISGKYYFNAGDVVYSKIRPNLRKAILTDAPGLCSADMYPMRAKDSVNSRFLLALLLGRQFSAFAESESVRTGIPKLNRTAFSSYRCPLPPRAEQDRIAVVLKLMDDAAEALRTHCDKVFRLKQRIMTELLFGGRDVQ